MPLTVAADRGPVTSGIIEHMSMLEFFLQSAEPDQIAVSGPLAIRPVVVDANALASDVYYAAAHGGHSSLLLAAGLGTIRLFTPPHIYGKVYAELDNPNYEPWAELRNEARRIWESEYPAKAAIRKCH